jgi:hypothetical protein
MLTLMHVLVKLDQFQALQGLGSTKFPIFDPSFGQGRQGPAMPDGHW